MEELNLPDNCRVLSEDEARRRIEEGDHRAVRTGVVKGMNRDVMDTTLLQRLDDRLIIFAIDESDELILRPLLEPYLPAELERLTT